MSRPRKPSAPGARPRRARRRGGRSALMLLTFMLAGSGLLRFTGEPGRVLAESAADAMTREASDTAADADGETCAPAADIAQVIAALDRREATLKARESALADRLAALSLAEAEVQSSLADLETAETRLAALITVSEEAAEDDLARLTAVYESMKPKDAAKLFEEMAPEFAAGFLGRMRPDVAAEVMAGLKPETAYTVSLLLASRNANAPTR